MGLPMSLMAGSNTFVWPDLWLGTYTYNICLDNPAVTSVSRVTDPGEISLWDGLPYEEAGESLTFECATSVEHFIIRPGDEVTVVVSEDVVLDYTPPVELGTPTVIRLITWPSYWEAKYVSALVAEVQALGAVVHRISKWTGTGYLSYIPDFHLPGEESDFLISAGDVIFFSIDGSVLYGEDVSPEPEPDEEPEPVPDPVVPLILGGIFVVAVMAIFKFKK